MLSAIRLAAIVLGEKTFNEVATISHLTSPPTLHTQSVPLILQIIFLLSGLCFAVKHLGLLSPSTPNPSKQKNESAVPEAEYNQKPAMTEIPTDLSQLEIHYPTPEEVDRAIKEIFKDIAPRSASRVEIGPQEGLLLDAELAWEQDEDMNKAGSA